jgi:hypothetical protein
LLVAGINRNITVTLDFGDAVIPYGYLSAARWGCLDTKTGC